MASMVVAILISIAFVVDPPPQELVDFLRQRDNWLYDTALNNRAPLSFPPLKMPATNELAAEKEALAKSKSDLSPILDRIARNRSNKSLAKIVAKDRERAEKIKSEISDREKRIAALTTKAEEESRQLESWKLQKSAAEKKWREDASKAALKSTLEFRTKMELLPPNTPKLDPASLRIGAFGVLPKWPVGIEKLDPRVQRVLVDVGKRIANGAEPNRYEVQIIEENAAGGVAAAKGRHNVHVIQVFDDGKLLVSMLGISADLTVFLLDVGDTSGAADGTALRIDSLLVVTGTQKYTTVNGAARTVFVLRSVKADQLPPVELSH